MRNAAGLFLLVFCLSVPAALSAQQAQEITADQASAHLGQTVKICAPVITADYTKDAEGSPVVLRVGGTYPNQRINVVIWGKDRSKWSSAPEDMYRGHSICVTGPIQLYTGAPSIIASDPGNIEIQQSSGD